MKDGVDASVLATSDTEISHIAGSRKCAKSARRIDIGSNTRMSHTRIPVS